MSAFTLFLLALAGLAIFILWRYTIKRRVKTQTESFQLQDHATQIESMDMLGDRIMAKVIEELPAKSTLNTTSSSKAPLTLIEQARPSPIKAPSVNPELVPLVDKVTRVMIGKYTLADVDAINYVKRAVERVLLHIAKSKDVEQISNEYDPQYSNDLLLEACRDLFEYPRLDHMKKLLVGQFIINKSGDGDEIDTIYNYITSVALNRQIPATTRMNAADILSLSNSTRYLKIANQSLELLRQEEDVPRRALLRPGGGQQTTHIGRAPGGVLGGPRPTAIPHRRLGDTGLHGGERNDLFIIPPIIGRGDQDIQRALWEQIGARPMPKTERTVYEDGQNVHNTEINNSVLDAAKELVSNYRAPGLLSFDYNLTKNLPDTQRIKIEAAIHRITTDPSNFKHGTTLYSIFQSLLHFIAQSPQKDDLNTRLAQELTEMSGLCATGHLSRLMNVLQGFDVKPELKIKVKVGDEVYAKISHILQKALEDPANERVLDAMMDDTADKGILTGFVAKEINRVRPDLDREYDGIADSNDLDKELLEAAKKYAKSSSFTISNHLIASSK